MHLQCLLGGSVQDFGLLKGRIVNGTVMVAASISISPVIRIVAPIISMSYTLPKPLCKLELGLEYLMNFEEFLGVWGWGMSGCRD